VVKVVGWEVVGQNLAVQAVKRMDVRPVWRRGRFASFGPGAVIVDEDGPVTIPNAKRRVVDGCESKDALLQVTVLA
jgi:hypothetical protein